MSDNSNDRDVECLRQRLSAVHTDIVDQTKAMRRKQNRVLVVGLGLGLLSAVMLTRLSLQGRELDADALTMIARTEMQQHLPIARQEIEVRLKAEAPRIVQEGLQAAADSVPKLSVYLTKGLTDHLDSMNAEFEQRIVGTMDEKIRLSKVEIDRRFPDMSDREKVERLIEVVTNRFGETFSSSTDDLYPHYLEEIKRVQRQTADLREGDATKLTREQRLKRDILNTIVQLMRAEKAKRDS